MHHTIEQQAYGLSNQVSRPLAHLIRSVQLFARTVFCCCFFDACWKGWPVHIADPFSCCWVVKVLSTYLFERKQLKQHSENMVNFTCQRIWGDTEKYERLVSIVKVSVLISLALVSSESLKKGVWIIPTLGTCFFHCMVVYKNYVQVSSDQNPGWNIWGIALPS